MLVQRKNSWQETILTGRVRGEIPVLLLSIMLLSPLVFASSNSHNLVVNGVKIDPNPAKPGQMVTVRFNIRNNEENSTVCKVAAYCGECILGSQEISIGSRSDTLVSFELNTSTLNTGVFEIETLVEDSSGQQEIFDLGKIQIETESTNLDIFNWNLLLLAIPFGALALGLILIKTRKKKPNRIIPDDQLSEIKKPVKPQEKMVYLFDEILKEEERKIEDEPIPANEKEEKKKKKYAKVARARQLLDS